MHNYGRVEKFQPNIIQKLHFSIPLLLYDYDLFFNCALLIVHC